jgi:hypothetical protein
MTWQASIVSEASPGGTLVELTGLGGCRMLTGFISKSPWCPGRARERRGSGKERGTRGTGVDPTGPGEMIAIKNRIMYFPHLLFAAKL